MQSINDAISVLDKFFVGKHFPVTREAYQTLKSAVLAAQTNNSQRLAEAAQINHALKILESNYQRMEFLSDCFAGICRHCGEVTESCYCMRDD